MSKLKRRIKFLEEHIEYYSRRVLAYNCELKGIKKALKEIPNEST